MYYRTVQMELSLNIVDCVTKTHIYPHGQCQISYRTMSSNLYNLLPLHFLFCFRFPHFWLLLWVMRMMKVSSYFLIPPLHCARRLVWWWSPSSLVQVVIWCHRYFHGNCTSHAPTTSSTNIWPCFFFILLLVTLFAHQSTNLFIIVTDVWFLSINRNAVLLLLSSPLIRF